jgi:hypothetical protein
VIRARDYANVVATRALDWTEYADGIEVKFVHTFSGGAFSGTFRAKAGSFLPSRGYLAMADFHVTSGCMDFEGEEAPAGSWIHMQARHAEKGARFPVDTVWAANHYGTYLDFDPSGHAIKVVDGASVAAYSGFAARQGVSRPPESLRKVLESLVHGSDA